MKRRPSGLLKFILVLLFGATLYFGFRYLEQRTIYSPDGQITHTPAKIGLPFKKINLESGDGVTITGWFVPVDANETVSNRPTLLFLHGNAGNISYNLDRLRLFHDADLDVLIIDYRGYGLSEGIPTEHGLELDALAAYFYLTESLHVPAERLFLYGESLGAAVAIDLAMQVRAAGMIIEAPFTSTADRLQKKWPGVPWDLLVHDNYDSLAKISKINMPVLLIHSVDDEIIPFTFSQRLFAKAKEPKELFKMRGPHRESFINSFDTYGDKVTGFIAQYGHQPLASTNNAEHTTAPAGQTP